jgi:ribosome-associated protein
VKSSSVDFMNRGLLLARRSSKFLPSSTGCPRCLSTNEDRARSYLNSYGLGHGVTSSGELNAGSGIRADLDQKRLDPSHGKEVVRFLPSVAGRLPSVADVVSLLRDEGGALDVAKVDVSEKASFTNFLVICTGRSSAHIAALADRLVRDLRARAVTVNGSIVGLGDCSSPDWTVVDAGLVVAHILSEDTRRLYDLESLWTADNPPTFDVSEDPVL